MAPAPGVPVHGPALKAIRQSKGWSSGKFATACRISTGYLSNLERGEKPRASAEVVARMAEVLGEPIAAITSPHYAETASR